MDTREVRYLCGLFVSGIAISEASLRAAQGAVREMIAQAKELGLSEAEVIKVLLKPVLAPRRACDCGTCKGRRTEVSNG